jgi:signal transduction histidine kinase
MSTKVDLLLVDDDDVDRELVLRLIGEQYAVREVSTGREALRAVAERKPVCVLLDYRLPDIGGLQLLPSFGTAHIPVIILTGEESPEVIVQAMQAGAQDYLVKASLSPVALEHAITNAVEKMVMRRAIERKNQQLRTLASAVTLAEQRERRRISQVLHDHVQQLLYGVQMRAHLIGLDAGEQPSVQEHLQALESLIHDALRLTRTLTVELSPPILQNEGLLSALTWLANHMAESYGLCVTVSGESDYHSPSEDLQVLLFQLVRELLFNIVKHAGVNQATVKLWEEENQVVIQVTDEGRGFDASKIFEGEQTWTGFGLYGVHERLALFGGQLTLDTRPGAGVRATIIAPKDIRPSTIPLSA